MKRSWPVRLVLVAALLLAVPFLFDAGSTVHAADNEIAGVTLTSPNPGELVITWDAPSRAPDDYRVTWKKSTARWPSYRNDNTVDGGNAFPTGTSHTVSDLKEGTEYSVRVRARYYDGNDNLTESGPWSDPPAELTVSAQLPSAQNRSDKEQVPPRKSKKSPPLHDNLSYSLNELIRQNQSQGTSRGDRLPRDGGAVEETATVVVYVEAAHVQDVALFLRNNGATVRSPDPGDDYLVAEVPHSLLPRLSQRPDVKFVKVDEPVSTSGGPGATAHGAAPWDTAGYDGTGIKVGVIDTGFVGYSALIGTHLPQPEAVRCWTSKMEVQHDNLADCEAASESNHGTAVTEMLFDVAPGATYYLARILNSSHAKEAVDWLIEKDVDVINMSVAFAWDGPGDGTSPYSNTVLTTVDTAVHGGAFIAATAGNQGGESWYGELADSDGDNVLEFKEGDECNLVTLEADKDYRFDLRWNDDWRTASIDLDTRLTGPDGVGAIVGRSERSQDGMEFRDPFERISYTPTVAGDYCFVVEIESGHTIPTWAQFMVDSSLHVTIEHTTEGYSIGNPGETKNEGALTVGAAAHDDTTTIATYSSRGPLPDGTIKPDIVGADKVHSQVYDSDATGTSFSAPHVAGLAAVVKERFPDYSPSELATYLKDNALARGSPTPNNTWGHGFAHLPAKPPSQPVVTGRAHVGEALAVNTSAITDGDGVTTATANSGFSVQWILVDSDNAHKDIDSATSSTYTITAPDRMHRIKARVSFTDDAGNDEVATSEATNVVNSEPTGILAIDGTARIGRTLTARVLKVEDTDGVVEPFTYQWVRVGPGDAESDITPATSSTYRLTDADAGHRIKFKLGFTDGIGNTETLESELTTTVGPHLLVGNTGQTAVTTSYISILPATASTPTRVAQSFTTGSEDNYLITSLKAFVSTGTPTAEIWDDKSGAPGEKVGDLTNPDSIPSGAVPDQLIEFSAADVSLDRETTYWVLFTLDSGQIRVRTTTLTDEDDGSEEKWAIGDDFSAFIHEGTAWETGMSDQLESGPVMIQVNGVVLNSNDEPVGDLLLSGAAQVGEVLTVDMSSVSDPNGLADATFEYQWVRIDGDTETDIGSATGTSYTLMAGDEGKRIKLKVTYTDDAGYDENLVSVPTQPVRPQDGIGIMVTNLYQESSGTTYADRDYPHLMQAFDTGDNADGYTLNGVRVGAIAWDDGVNPVVSITEDDVFQGKSAPGRVLYTMATTTAISTDKDNPSVDVDFAAGDVYLAPNTRYWVQFFFPGRGDGSVVVGVTPEDDDDLGAAPGWTIADFHVYTIPGQVLSSLRYDDNNQLRIAVLGKAGAGNRLPEGQPAISGEAQVNEVLTAGISGITDGDGLTMATYTYQWVRVDGATDTDIRDATSQTYTLAEDDLGKRFRVEVSFSDDRGHSAELSSRATQPVRPESGDGIQVSNAGQDTADLVGVDEDFPLNAISFTTGGHSSGYSLTSVRVAGIVNDDGATPKASLYDDSSGLPGTVLHALVVPSDIPTGDTENPAPAELTADTPVLTPNTTYWVVFEKPDSTGNFYLRYTDTTDDDFGAASGWSVGDELAFQRKEDRNWLKSGLVGGPYLFQITVKADLFVPFSGKPEITGSTYVGQRLKALTDDITLAGGVTNPTYSFQWIRVDGSAEEDIEGAMEQVYALTSDDENSEIRVRVTATGDPGVSGQVISDLSESISPSVSGDIKLVGNFSVEKHGRPTFGAKSTRRLGQPFSTGDNLDGYILSSVVLDVANGEHAPHVSVHLHADSGGVPGAAIFGLNATGTAGLVTFTPEAGADTVLDPGTTYHIIVASSLFVTGGHSGYTIEKVHNGEDEDSQSEWEIDDYAISSDSGPWGEEPNESFRMQVNGRLGVPPEVSGVSILSLPLPNRFGYRSGENIEVAVSFDSPVTASSSVDVDICLASADDTCSNRTAVLMAGEGTNKLLFTYRVQPGDSDLDGIAIPSDSLGDNSGKEVKHALNHNPASLSHSGIPRQFAHPVSGTPHCNETICAKLTPAPVGGDRGFAVADDLSETGKITNRTFEHEGHRNAIRLLTVDSTGRVTLGLYKDFTQSVIDDFILDVSGTPLALSKSVAGDDGRTRHWGGTSVRFIANRPIDVYLKLVNREPEGEVDIEGVEMVGQTLAADHADLTDADGLTSVTYAYKWYRVATDDSATEIDEAQSSTYTLVDADLDHTISVELSYTDDRGFDETATSSPTAVVLADEVRVLVGTPTGRGNIRIFTSQDVLQKFRTGSHEQGYRVEDFRVTLAEAPSRRLVVSLHSSTEDGQIGDRLFYFIPLDPPTDRTPTYSVPHGSTLEPNTLYFLRFEGGFRKDFFPTNGPGVSSNSVPGWTAPGDSRVPMSIRGIPLRDAPRVTGVEVTTSPANGEYYMATESIRVEVTFNEEVTVSGAPSITLRMGDDDTTATYESRLSSASSLIFMYTVRAGDQDNDGIEVIGNSLSGDITRRGTQIPADLAHNPILDDAGQRVKKGPILRSVVVTSTPLALGIYGLGEKIQITATFDEPVTVTGSPHIPIVMVRTVNAEYDAASSMGATVVFSYTVTNRDQDVDGIFVGKITLQDEDSIQNGVGTLATLGLARIGHLPDHKVDGFTPRIASVQVTSVPVGASYHLRRGRDHRVHGDVQPAG